MVKRTMAAMLLCAFVARPALAQKPVPDPPYQAPDDLPIAALPGLVEGISVGHLISERADLSGWRRASVLVGSGLLFAGISTLTMMLLDRAKSNRVASWSGGVLAMQLIGMLLGGVAALAMEDSDGLVWGLAAGGAVGFTFAGIDAAD